MNYKSTRGQESGVSASLAILKGLASDGGLFMPEKIPVFDFKIPELMGLGYQRIAYEIMKLYFTDFTQKELMDCINKAYDNKFDNKEITPIAKVDGAYYLELFHGNTIAFKDMALSILPHLMTTAAKKNGVTKKIVILTATSGDTGKAAMSGFADVDGTGIIVFYPKGGVSKIQELQMLTQKGKNTYVVAIHGNFDDAQTAVKEIFNDTAFAKELDQKDIWLSSANSINIGRLIPQIVYYVYSYIKLLEAGEIDFGEPINICVPTGNFGNILAAKLAKMMGLPVHKLICASNDNKVLYDFFSTGTYDKNRDFLLTSSPSMDILISSNLERLIYLSCNCNANTNLALMQELSTLGSYTITPSMRAFMSDFVGGYATEEQNAQQIKKVYDSTGYLMDTHTGVASAVYEQYKAQIKDTTKTVITSTASPYKFARSVMETLQNLGDADEWEIIDLLNLASGVDIPKAISELQNAPILHTLESDIQNMKNTVGKILNL